MHLRSRTLPQLGFFVALIALTARASAQQLTREERAAHAISRLTFGARPGDLDRVLQIGTERWIAQQLAGVRSSDSLIASELARFPLWSSDRPDMVRRAPSDFFFAYEVMRPGDPPLPPPDTMKLKLQLDSASKLSNQFTMGRVVRADLSETQLLEVLTDFWQNHFSVHSSKVPTRAAMMSWDTDVIRPRALGSFRELLGAVAHSPAMLSYLDNHMSGVDPERLSKSEHDTLQLTGVRPKRIGRTGLNENYGRELLELHTLGVDGGYTQGDVINVARAFTGWYVPNASAGDNGVRKFLFLEWMHDAEVKTVLGRTLAAGRGEEDGEDVLDILASHPSTARFIAKKLAVRFVSDSPSNALVDSAAATFRRTSGDIREVLRTILTSEEFFSRATFRSKVKSPQEFVFSMRRALFAPTDTAQETPKLLSQLGQPIFGRLTPDGWPETGSAWLNTEGMFRRIGVAQLVSRDEQPAIPFGGSTLWSLLRTLSFEAQVDMVVKTILAGTVSPETRSVLIRARPAPTATPAEQDAASRELVMLALSSPDFQRR